MRKLFVLFFYVIYVCSGRSFCLNIQSFPAMEHRSVLNVNFLCYVLVYLRFLCTLRFFYIFGKKKIKVVFCVFINVL